MRDRSTEIQSEVHFDPQDRLWRKIRFRMQIPLLIIVILSSIDRVNISFAALQMNAELGLTSRAFGIAVGAFFAGYVLFQFPSSAIQRRIGTRHWITGTILLWGICATSMAFVHHASTLYAVRFLLGVAESGLAPGIVYYCVTWMPRRFHAGAIAIILLAIPASVIIGGPISGWLLSEPNPLGIAGWRWMFLVEGVPSVLVASVAYAVLSNRPEDAKWLTAAEKDWLRKELSSEQAADSSSATRVTPRRLFAAPARWSAAGIWFALLLGANGLIFWLPQVLKQLSGAGDFAVGVMSAVPWLGISVGMLLNAWHSDVTGERYWHLSAAILLGGCALLGASLVGTNLPALALLFAGGLGLGGAQSVFWAIPRSLWGGASLASGITFINLVGNLASLAGPWMIGALRQHTGSFQAPVVLIVVVLTLSAALVGVMRRSGDRALKQCAARS